MDVPAAGSEQIEDSKDTEEKRNELQEQFTYQLQKSKQRRYGPPKT